VVGLLTQTLVVHMKRSRCSRTNTRQGKGKDTRRARERDQEHKK